MADAPSSGLAGFAPYSYRDDPCVPDFPNDKPLIVFDGVCVLCNGTAQFVLKHDKQDAFCFTHAQSALGQALYRHYRLDTTNLETMLLIEHGRAYAKLDAAMQIAKRLGWPWRGASALLVLPQPLRDWFYGIVARNRYRLFGRHESCLAPTQALRQRFVG